MDPVTKQRMRTAHLNHGETCTCGRKVFGNGRNAHLRTCDRHLAAVGWPLGDDMRQAILDEYRGRGADTVIKVQRRLGQLYLARRRAGNRAALPWSEFRDLVWEYAEKPYGAYEGELSD